LTRRALLVAFSVTHFAHHVTNSLLSALLPFIRDAFGLSYTDAGFLVGAYSIASGVTNAPLGVLADRVGARRVIVWGLVLIGLSSVAIGLSTEYWQLLAFLAVMGIASGTYHAPASALIAELFSSRRGMAMGTHTTAGHLSFFAAPLLAGILATAGSWRTPYIAFAIAPIACAILLWRVAPLGTRSTGRHSWLATGSDIASVARRVGALVSLSIVFQVVISAAMAFLSTYLVDARGIAPGIAAALFGVPQLAGLVGASFIESHGTARGYTSPVHTRGAQAPGRPAARLGPGAHRSPPGPARADPLQPRHRQRTGRRVPHGLGRRRQR